MVVAFLTGDYRSPRGRSDAYINLAFGDRADALVLKPDVVDDAANAERLAVLRCRQEVRPLLDLCPGGLEWRLVAVTVAELRSLLLLDYKTMRQLAPETRTVGEAATNVDDETVVVCEGLKERVQGIENSLAEQGLTAPPLIAVAPEPAASHLLLDGNTRAIAYARVFPGEDEIEVLVGYHEAVVRWQFYGA